MTTIKRRRNWPLILVGVLSLLAFLGIGAIIAVTAWVRQHLEIQETTATDAETQFEAVRREFGQRPPLIEIRDGQPIYAGDSITPSSTPAAIERVRVLVFDPDEQKVVSFSLPFWLLRLHTDPFDLDAYVSGTGRTRVRLRPEDLEKFGPGIVLDTTTPDGEQVLVWTE